MRRLFFNLMALSAAALASSTHAQTGQPSGPAGDSVTIGLGVGLTTSYDGGRDYKLIPGGVLRGTISGHDFQVTGPQVFVDALRNDPRAAIDLELGPVAGAHFNRTGDVSDPRIAALGKLDTAIELGVRGAIGLRGVINPSDKLAFAITGIWDVAGAHRSHVISPAVEYSTMVSRRTYVRVALTSEFVGGRYADYYFGITPQGSTASGLTAYDPDGGLASIGGNLIASHSLNGRRTGWSLFGIASFKRLQGDLAASPIVRDTGSPHQAFASVGLGYTF